MATILCRRQYLIAEADTDLSRDKLYNTTPSVRFRSRMAFADGLIGIITRRIDACWGSPNDVSGGTEI